MSKLSELGKDKVQEIMDKSNSYNEALVSLGYLSGAGSNHTTLKNFIIKENISLAQFNQNSLIARRNGFHGEYTKEEFIEKLNSGICKLPSSKILHHLLELDIKECKCEHCNLSEWQGRPIPLQLHHKDKNHQNNILDNLMIVCPNCHSVLHDNFHSDKIKSRVKKDRQSAKKIAIYKGVARIKKTNYCQICGKSISLKATHCNRCTHDLVAYKRPDPYILFDVLKTYNCNFSQIGKQFGVSDNTVRKWCKRYGLPTKKDLLKSYISEHDINSNITYYYN